MYGRHNKAKLLTPLPKPNIEMQMNRKLKHNERGWEWRIAKWNQM
jgi:hypothetical protein